MDDLTDYLQRQRPPELSTVKNISREVIKPHQQPTPSMLENLCAVNFSFDSCSSNQHPDFHTSYVQQQISGSYHPSISYTLPVSNQVALNHNIFTERENIKHMEPSSSRTSKSFSPAASTCSFKKRNSSGRCKKGKEVDKMEEVVHVRARRGQATDSHSIAERVRREKINSKLRCLQELVPGCHKSMGMANMLEEIINYVHSLQNQVELLSMELAAASSAYDLTADKFFSKKLEGTNSPEAQGMQKWPREQYAELNNSHYSPWSI